ncbi:lysylphosphatidylglycerol synthase transmembrane domain-containing protein [Flavobacterium antarcticum]|uniref:lysylphosphatidylglycerol synthase transmembrane domain-containing protein n=1 Tax=Flavobacterium antarcticum TaxID=271155 RepID=UPI0003B636A5|nr:lysylphosphatidylglycerol synthase transmembrane domain-containing protein [Flavobacterium antarcticum]
MKKKISKWLSILLPLLLGVFLIVYQYNQFTADQLTEMKGYFKNANYFYIYLSLLIAVFGFASRAYRWKFSIEHMGYTSKFRNNFMAVCIGYFLNLTIPRSGEISRAVVVKKYEDIPFDKAFGTIVAERIVDLILFFLFVLTAFIVQFKVLKDFIFDNIPVEKLILLAFIGFVGFIIFVLLWLYSKWRFIIFMKEKLAGLMEGMLSIVKMKKKWPFLFHSLFIWFTYILMFYVAIFALDETSTIGLGAIITAFVIGSFAIGFTNSGFGAFPLLIAQIFLLYSIPETVGTAFGWLVWISQTALMIVLGGLSLFLLPILNKNK